MSLSNLPINFYFAWLFHVAVGTTEKDFISLHNFVNLNPATYNIEEIRKLSVICSNAFAKL